VLLATVTEMTIWSYFVYHITALRNRKQPGNQMYGWIDPQTRYFLLTVNFGIGTLPLFFQPTATSIAPLYWEWVLTLYNVYLLWNPGPEIQRACTLTRHNSCGAHTNWCTTFLWKTTSSLQHKTTKREIMANKTFKMFCQNAPSIPVQYI
jgi:hypothetical protein